MASSGRANGKTFEKHEAPNAVWNVARCNRLLRPISSKIKTLRKEASLAQTVDGQERRSNTWGNGGSGSELSRSTKSAQHSIEDQDWAFYKPKQGVKRKYGNRSASAASVSKREPIEKRRIESTPNQSGSINVPTPYIRKLFLGQQNSPLSAIKPNNQSRELQENKQWRVVRLAKSKHLCSSTEGLGQAFEQVLIATKGTTPTKLYNPAESKGARSLFSTCLRSLPKAISEEQNERAASDPGDKSDVSAEVYASLEETFELTPGRGWPPFRELILAHVIEIFKEGFDEHLFEPAFIRALLDYCKLYGAFTEAQSLLASFAAKEEAAKPPRTTQDCILKKVNLCSMNCLDDYVMKLFSGEFKTKMIANLVETGKFHVAWITGGGPESVRDLASTLTRPDASIAAAGQYITETVLLASCGLLPIPAQTKQIRHGKPRKSRYLRQLSGLPSDFQTGLGVNMCIYMSYLCSLLCALALAPFFENRQSETCGRVARTFNSVSISIKENFAAISENPLACRMAIAILLADYILAITVSKSETEQCSVVNRQKASALAQLYTPTDLAATEMKPDLKLITTSVECINIAKKDSETLILKIIESLRSGVDWHNPTVDSSWSPWKLALDIALHYSQKSHAKARAQYAAIAIEIEEQIKTSRRKVEDRQAAKGLRWEEGICEWVTADTPAGIKRAQRTQPSKRALGQPQAPQPTSLTKASEPAVTLSRGSQDSSTKPGLSNDIGFAKYADSHSNTARGLNEPHPRLFDFNNIFTRNFTSHQTQPPQEEKTTAKCHTLKRKPVEPLLPLLDHKLATPTTSASRGASARVSLSSSKADETDPDESSLFSTASAASSMSSLSPCTSLVLSQGTEPSPPKIKRLCHNKPKPPRLFGVLDAKSNSKLEIYDDDDDDDDDSDRDELSITPIHVRQRSNMKRAKLR